MSSKKGWAIKHPKFGIILMSIRQTRSQSIQAITPKCFEEEVYEELSWRRKYRKGYRAVKVTINES